jgi:orotate phosphoribosyltransferase-like protein
MDTNEPRTRTQQAPLAELQLTVQEVAAGLNVSVERARALMQAATVAIQEPPRREGTESYGGRN